MEKSKFLFILGLCGIMALAFLASQLVPAFAVTQQPLSVGTDRLAQQQQRIPTPVGAVTKAPYSQPLPTRANDKSNATPTLIPPIKVRLGPVTEIQLQDTPRSLTSSLGRIKSANEKYAVVGNNLSGRYTVLNGADNYNGYRKLFVRDAQTGQELRLGNDSGDAYAPAVTDQYVVWSFRCYDACDTNPVTNGLYIYDFSQGANARVGDLAGQNDLKADGRWIGYLKFTDIPDCYGDLYVFNLDTKKEQRVDSTVPGECKARTGFFAISNNRLVWTHFDESGSKQWTLGLLDLKAGQFRQVKIPYGQGTPPYGLSFSGDYVVWGIFGYDLRQDAIFNFSLAVPGWENLLTDGSLRPVVKDERVYWGESIKGQVHYFSAPLIRVNNPYPGP